MLSKLTLGDHLVKVGKPIKYLTNGKAYKIILITPRNISVIDDEDEELIVDPDFYYKSFIKIYKS